MNERIKELKREAEALAYEEHKANCIKNGRDPSMPHANALNMTFEKFAELIAKECARLAMTQHCSTSPDDYDDMEPYEQGRDDTASTISGLIRRTFGVRE